MKRLLVAVILTLTFGTFGNVAFGQRAGFDWLTESSDAQRSAWVRTDGKISPESLQRRDPSTGFQYLWKMKLNNTPAQLNSLHPPATLDRLIGYRGFRMLGFVAGSSNRIFTIDTDLGRMEWEKQLKVAPSTIPGTLACPGGMTTGIIRPLFAAIPPAPAGPVGRGRNTPAKSAVGEPGQGGVTLANIRPTPPAPAPAPAAPPRPNPANPAGGQLGAGPFLIQALAGDGMYHSMHLSNGADFEPAVRFLPAGANASGFVLVDQVAYAATNGNCNGVANGLWALDLASKQVTSWKGNVAGTAGAAFDGAGTVYITTGSGGENANSIVALEPKSLRVKSSYNGGAEFTSSPVVFDHKGRTMIAASTKDGRIHVLDSSNLSAAVASSAAWSSNFTPGALSSWQDRDGTRWILAAVDGALPAGFTAPEGGAANGSVVAWRLVERNGGVSLEAGWASRNLTSPLTPSIINGVVFAVSSGEYRTSAKLSTAQRILRSGKAVIYALDGKTGKELWNSGATVKSFARGGAISGGMGQIYLTTHDGTIYTFGFPMEH
jgi:sugar lactone lactonase YvrE